MAIGIEYTTLVKSIFSHFHNRVNCTVCKHWWCEGHCYKQSRKQIYLGLILIFLTWYIKFAVRRDGNQDDQVTWGACFSVTFPLQFRMRCNALNIRTVCVSMKLGLSDPDLPLFNSRNVPLSRLVHEEAAYTAWLLS